MEDPHERQHNGMYNVEILVTTDVAPGQPEHGRKRSAQLRSAETSREVPTDHEAPSEQEGAHSDEGSHLLSRRDAHPEAEARACRQQHREATT